MVNRKRTLDCDTENNNNNNLNKKPKPINPSKQDPKDPSKNPLKKNNDRENENDPDNFLVILFPDLHERHSNKNNDDDDDNNNDNGMFNRMNRQHKPEKISDICINPLCNHKTMKEDPTPVEIPNIKTIENVSDLIELGKSYHCKKNKEYDGINLRILCNLVAPLSELNSMIGLSTVKIHMVDQILFFIRGYQSKGKCGKCIDCSFDLPCPKNQKDMLHTVISGPPGTGKTELGKILGKIYKGMGILSNDKFKSVGRSDLIAGYLGQTATKTQKVIDNCSGGVLFIDEAYSLGNEELRDSFSKECIDTLNQNLSERRDFLCIIAGYKKQLEKCFFAYNDGLRRRFTFRYDLIPYKWNELKQIFELKVKLGEFKMCYLKESDDSNEMLELKDKENKQIEDLFKKNKKFFPNNGGDIETLFLNCKIVHSRTITNKIDDKFILSVDDITKGIEKFVLNRDYKGIEKNKTDEYNMYT